MLPYHLSKEQEVVVKWNYVFKNVFKEKESVEAFILHNTSKN